IVEIRDHGRAPCEHVRDLLDTRLSDIELQIAQLSALRDTIVDLRDNAAHPEPDTCNPDQICRYV
ncbi:MerR family transcriptional regulator, partial [Microbacterium sp. CH12i]